MYFLRHHHIPIRLIKTPQLIIRFHVEKVPAKLLFTIFNRLQLVDTRPPIRRVSSEGYVELTKKRIHPLH